MDLEDPFQPKLLYDYMLAIYFCIYCYLNLPAENSFWCFKTVRRLRNVFFSFFLTSFLHSQLSFQPINPLIRWVLLRDSHLSINICLNILPVQYVQGLIKDKQMRQRLLELMKIQARRRVKIVLQSIKWKLYSIVLPKFKGKNTCKSSV